MQLGKMLMAEVFGLSFEKVLIDQAIELSDAKKIQLQKDLQLLQQYHPIQYVLGKAHFFGREFKVNHQVLIPRQETEELVNEILVDNSRDGLMVLDIGAGSGCIGITLGLELKNSEVTLLDVDAEAMEVALNNAMLHELQVKKIVDDVLSIDLLPAKYDIIVSNPPYVTESEKSKMLNNVLQHEPSKALFVPDDDPLIFYEKIISLAKNHLTNQGKLYFEINESYGADLVRLCEQEQCSYVDLVKDLSGKDRILKAMFS